jgi:DNA-binding NarL/FixJ family response regulator
MGDVIRIAAVDDHSLYLQGLRRAFSQASDMELVAEGATAEEACKIAVDAKPDVLLLDLNIPGNGIAAARTIASLAPRVKIVMLTGYSDDDQVGTALEAGIKGYVLKGAGAREIQESVRAVHRDQPYIAQDLASRLLVRNGGIPRASERYKSDFCKLTCREDQVIKHAAAGLTNKEIAQKLDLPVRTVRNCMSTILHKCGARTRLEAVLAFEQWNNVDADRRSAAANKRED